MDWLEPHVTVGTLVYVGIVLLVGLVATARLLWWINTVERRRRSRLENIDLDDAVRSDQRPLTRTQAEQRVLTSLEAHYTVTRRMVIPLALAITLALASLPFLADVPASAVSVVVAAITVVVGVATRSFVENAFAGLVLAQSRHVHIGDTVNIDGKYGVIEDITFTHTTVKLWDWRRLVLPNTQMMQKSFLNYSLHDPYLWSCTEIWLALDEDIDHVRAIALEAVTRCEHFAPHEEPRFWLMDMTRDAVQVWIAAWADTPADGWLLTAEIRDELLRAFRREGVRGHVQHVTLRSGDEVPRQSAPPPRAGAPN